MWRRMGKAGAQHRQWADLAMGEGRPVGEGEINEGKGEGDARPSIFQDSDRIRRGGPAARRKMGGWTRCPRQGEHLWRPSATRSGRLAAQRGWNRAGPSPGSCVGCDGRPLWDAPVVTRKVGATGEDLAGLGARWAWGNEGGGGGGRLELAGAGRDVGAAEESGEEGRGREA